MTEEATFRRFSMALERKDERPLDAGTVRAMLVDAVECHPADQPHLWGRGLSRGAVPPTATLHVSTEHITLLWNSNDVDAYDTAYEAEKQKRENQQAQDAPAVVSDAANDSL